MLRLLAVAAVLLIGGAVVGGVLLGRMPQQKGLAQNGWIAFGNCEVHDLLSGGRYTWSGSHNFVELSPHTLPAHVFKVTRK